MAVITIVFRATPHAEHSAPSPAHQGWFPRVWVRLQAALTLRRTRSLLRGMDDRMLADIGLNRSDAAREADRPLWHASLLR